MKILIFNLNLFYNLLMNKCLKSKTSTTRKSLRGKLVLKKPLLKYCMFLSACAWLKNHWLTKNPKQNSLDWKMHFGKKYTNSKILPISYNVFTSEPTKFVANVFNEKVKLISSECTSNTSFIMVYISDTKNFKNHKACQKHATSTNR